MTTIALDRRFYEWSKGETLDPSMIERWGLQDKSIAWQALLERRRVVVLAEAGSGKSEEFEEQVRQLTAAGKHAFYCTVQDVGKEGLEGSLPVPRRAALAAWKGSEEGAWFFIDSVDEALLNGVRFGLAIRKLAEGVRGAESRAHIVISCRHTDWNPTSNLEELSAELPIPEEAVPGPPPTLKELVVRVLRHQHADPPPPREVPIVVLLAPLDSARVEAFAIGKGIADADEFLKQIEQRNLWQFARRPLDLGWMVQFWAESKRFGTLSEMIELSLTERLKESQPNRLQVDLLDGQRAMGGMRRVGAAMVFARRDTIAIPDDGLALTAAGATAEVSEVLPDWTPQQRMRLLERAVFDPATFGKARLHNDNEGVVRGYLTARWLLWLKEASLPRAELSRMLFGKAYGVEGVRPALQETAAWLSLWDASVSKEVCRRTPYLLLTAGDPEELPVELRAHALAALIKRMAKGDMNVPMLDQDSLRRFSHPEFAETIRRLWSKYGRAAGVCALLMQIVWLGRISACNDLAEEALGMSADAYASVFAGRAILATGTEDAKQRYLERVRRDSETLHKVMVWDALEAFFPDRLRPSELMAISDRVEEADQRDSISDLQWRSKSLLKGAVPRNVLEELVQELLKRLCPNGSEAGDEEGPTGRRARGYVAALGVAVRKLLEASQGDEAPEVAADASLCLGRHAQATTDRPDELAWINGELQNTTARRRFMFWRAAAQLANTPMLRGSPLVSPFQMSFLGWPATLTLIDLDWLLDDGRARPLANERILSINAAMVLWRDAGKPRDVELRVRDACAADSDMERAFEQWVSPPAPSPEAARMTLEMEENRARFEAERDEGEQSWVEMIERLQADASERRKLVPGDRDHIDNRLHHLWQMLMSAQRRDSGDAVTSVDAIRHVLGDELAEEFKRGLIALWKLWPPLMRSDREADQRNYLRDLDLMGLAGVSLESAANPDFARTLTDELALRAAQYATFELNGFPKWLDGLSRAAPRAVIDVLLKEVRVEFDYAGTDEWCQTINNISSYSEALQRLMAPLLLDELKTRASIPPRGLEALMRVISKGGDDTRRGLYALAIKRFYESTETAVCGKYMAAAYAIDSQSATSALLAKISNLPTAEQTPLAVAVLPGIFGSRFSSGSARLPELSVPDLERLVVLSFGAVRTSEDNDRASGAAYTPDTRDHAEEARSNAFNLLVQRPGRETFDALIRLSKRRNFSVGPARLRELARDRAIADLDEPAWKLSRPFELERKYGEKRDGEWGMTKFREKLLAAGFGVLFVVVTLILALVVKQPTPFQYLVFRIVFALSASGVASMLPGFVEVRIPNFVRAGGALAVFVLVMFFNPAPLVSQPPGAVSVEVEPRQISMRPGASSRVHYRIRESGGAMVRMRTEDVRWRAPDGTDLLVKLGETIPEGEVSLDPHGSADRYRDIYLPIDVADKVASSRLKKVELDVEFHGADVDGHPVSAKSVLDIEIAGL